MKRVFPLTTLFLDICEVLFTDGWDYHTRQQAAAHFELELSEMEARHLRNKQRS